MEVPEQPDEIDAALDIEVAAPSGAEEPPAAKTATAELIRAGESRTVEFKQTGRVNIQTKQRDQVLEQMVVKSVAGFLNAEGGILLIGVTDTGEVSGIEKDLKTLGSKKNLDGFALWLNGLLDNALGPTAASSVSLRFDDFPEGTVCRLDVRPGKSPTFVRSGKADADLYVRLNNATRLLNTAEALEYVRSHWR